MVKLSQRKKLANKLDKLCNQYVKLRDGHSCQKCGKSGTSQIHWSHVVPRSAGNRLRWDVNNSKCLCSYHHVRFWHSSPLEAMEWFKEKFPERYEHIMREKVKGTKKFSIQDLEDMIEDFERLIKELS